VGDASAYVIVVLAAPSRINIQIRHSGVEITGFEAGAPAMPKPHVQASAKLNYARIGAGWAGICSVVIER